jgi:hypothetical protein
MCPRGTTLKVSGSVLNYGNTPFTKIKSKLTPTDHMSVLRELPMGATQLMVSSPKISTALN